MRICPTCSFELKEYNYFFCSNCLSELPQDKIKFSQPNLINVRLNFSMIPEERFLFFRVPYENRFSLKVMKFLLLLVGIICLVLFFAYNKNYGF